jgi:catechol 2,3-dioxygenase-like lactoylglutathione lyase family enzyme
MKALRLAWVGVRTDDLDATAHFFREVLGLDVVLEEEGTVELELPAGERVQLFAPGHPYHDHFGAQARGPVPLFEVDDLDEAERRLRNAGYDLVGERERDSSWEWLEFRGPDGNLYELGCRRG